MTGRLGRGGQVGRLAVTAVVSLALATAVAWFIDQGVTQLMLAQVVARATDQVEFGLLPRVTSADFEPPYTPVKLDELSARLDPLLDRARESSSGVIRFNLFALDGTVLYSDLHSMRGQVISPLTNPGLAAALAGSVDAQLTELTGEENVDLGPRYATALEAYVPCILDGRVAAVYEFYADASPLRPIRWAIWTSIGLMVMLLLGVLALTGRPKGRSAAVSASRAPALPGAPAVIGTGLVRLPPRIQRALLPGARIMPGAQTNSPSECWLTRREVEVLMLLATNGTYRDIAMQLSLSEETVRSHVKSILHKLGQPDRARAVAAATRAGILQMSSTQST